VAFAGYLIPIGDAGIDSEGAKAYRDAFITDMLSSVTTPAPSDSSSDLDTLARSWLVLQFDRNGAAQPDFAGFPKFDPSAHRPADVRGGVAASVAPIDEDEQAFEQGQLYANIRFASHPAPAAYGVSVGVGFFGGEPTFWNAWAWRDN
jgi:hypothetical protein